MLFWFWTGSMQMMYLCMMKVRNYQTSYTPPPPHHGVQSWSYFCSCVADWCGFFRRRTSRNGQPGPDWQLLKCIGLLSLAVLLGVMSVMNISLAFFLAVLWVPVMVTIRPTSSRYVTVESMFRGHCDERMPSGQGAISHNGVLHVCVNLIFRNLRWRDTCHVGTFSGLFRCPLETGFTVCDINTSVENTPCWLAEINLSDCLKYLHVQ